MAKTETNKPADNPAADTSATVAPRPALGSIANFTVAEGVHLRNSETGAYFVPGEPTPQTVTITTLRRLDDGDLQLA